MAGIYHQKNSPNFFHDATRYPYLSFNGYHCSSVLNPFCIVQISKSARVVPNSPDAREINLVANNLTLLDSLRLSFTYT